MDFSTIKGFKDILPGETLSWQKTDMISRQIFRSFGFQEIKTPLMEKTELFSRSIGQETDIVSKEMYTIADSKGNGMTLRPEATASVARAYIQHRLYLENPVSKLFSIGPMFRHERPQKGRFRQFHQINAEMIGDPGPKSDADIIIMAMHLFESIGLDHLTLQLNSLGCPECRPLFKNDLKTYLEDKSGSMCEDCIRRSYTNPLRVFDCKNESCVQILANAPSITDFICTECRGHFEKLKGYLDSNNVPYVQNPHLVRGLDYYNRTAFEIQTEKLGAQNAVGGGGRYDGLIKLLGGPDHPAIGFAIGFERLMALLEEKAKEIVQVPELFIAAIGEKSEQKSLTWVTGLRKMGFWIEMDHDPAKGLKAQMKKAGRLGAKKVLIIGDDELLSGKATLRDMEKKTQEEITIEDILEKLKNKISA